MDDLISRKAAIDAVAELATSMSVCISVDECHGMKRMQGMAVRMLDELPSSQQGANAYSNMSDEEFEEWLYKHGICNPDIHESIPCSAVPLLIDNAISELPSAEPKRIWHPVETPPTHHRDVIVRGIEAIGNVTVHKVMQWDVDTWRPTNYAPSISWKEWSEIDG